MCIFVEAAQAVSSLPIRGVAHSSDSPGRGRDGTWPGQRARRIVSEPAVTRPEHRNRQATMDNTAAELRGSDMLGRDSLIPLLGGSFPQNPAFHLQ